MIVADTNLVAYLMVRGEQTAVAHAVWAKDDQWRLPTLWRSEFLSVLTTTIRARATTIADAYDMWYVALALFAHKEVEVSDVSGVDVLKVAIDRNVSAYDAQFVILATTLAVPLVTADRRLLTACPDLAVSPEQFAR